MDAIKIQLEQYPIRMVQDISTIKAGAENTNYLVTASNGRYVFRVYNEHHSARGKRSARQIEQELAFMERAREAGLSVPEIIRTHDAEAYTTATFDDGTRFVALFAFMAGTSPTQHSQEIAIEIGRLVNDLFPVSQSFAHTHQTMQYDLLTRSTEAWDTLVDKGIAIPQVMIDLKAQVDLRAKTIDLGTLSTGIVHYDLKLANLLFDTDERLTGVLDFDDFRYSYLLEEPVMALMHHLHDTGENLLRSGFYDDFIAQLTHPTLQAELVHLDTFLSVRLLQDLASYLLNGLDSLVDELLADSEIEKRILSQIA